MLIIGGNRKNRDICTYIMVIRCIGSLFFLLLSSCGEYESYSDTGTSVYICSGPYAKRYHSRSNCYGLNDCSGSIYSISINSAKSKGRTPCRICCK